MNGNITKKGQEIFLADRARLKITAVTEVLTFDPAYLTVRTDMGDLAVDGAELRITELSHEKGELYIEGLIDGFVFFDSSETKKKRGFKKQ